MRLSRWGRSPYETIENIEAEAKALGRFVDVVKAGDDAEIIVVHSKIPFGLAELKQAPSIALLMTTTSGTDHIDLDVLAENGIQVARLPEARRDAVVDASIGMLIWGLRRQGMLVKKAREGVWARDQLAALRPVGLRGSSIGLVGLGVIGRQVATVLHALGAKVVGVDPMGLPVGVPNTGIDTMLASCDAISLHCDLNTTSENILSAERLAGARPGLVVVNTARGALVDVHAAIELVVAGHIGGLALDVFPEEPFPGLESMSRHPQLLFTPHSAGYHTTLPQKIQAGLLVAVEAFVSGEAVPHRV
jgi:phosphoglycerate dehydrogenase-like enzyme